MKSNLGGPCVFYFATCHKHWNEGFIVILEKIWYVNLFVLIDPKFTALQIPMVKDAIYLQNQPHKPHRRMNLPAVQANRYLDTSLAKDPDSLYTSVGYHDQLDMSEWLVLHQRFMFMLFVCTTLAGRNNISPAIS